MSPELTESKTQFANRLNVTKGYITQLVNKNLPLTPEGLVRVDAALAWIRGNVKPDAGRPAGSVATGKQVAADDLTAAKIRLALVQAERAELELRMRRGEALDRADAVAVLRSMMRGFRDNMLNFPNRHGPAMAAQFGMKPAEFVGALESYIREALNEFADAPNPFASLE